jgi:RNA polymerase sigma-70 factor (ECF subfamily)
MEKQGVIQWRPGKGDEFGHLGELCIAQTFVMKRDTSPVSDDLVLDLIAQGAYRSALEVLVRGYQHLIVRYCTAMLGVAAQGEEVAQEVFLGAYATMPRFRQEATLRTWLWAIARKQCLKALRDRGRRRRIEADRQHAIASGAHRAPPDPPEEDPAVLQQRVRQSLDRLVPEERSVLVLRYDTGLPLLEIAHILGRSEVSVRRQLARALQHLREVMDAE